MKKLFLTTLIYLLANNSFSQAFVTTWNTLTDNYIIIPGYGTNYSIQWVEIGNPSHNGSLLGTNITTVNFGTAGHYKVSISGGSPAFNKIKMGNNYNEALKLDSILDWGSIIWYNMDGAFAGCENLVWATSAAPNLAITNDLSGMFSSCKKFNTNLSNWDVSKVTNMGSMFQKAVSFNKPLDNWDVSNVTNMSFMFFNASSFNQPINNWDVSKVTDMSHMFSAASLFNQPINNWNVNKVTNMGGMFREAVSFNQPLGNWNVSSVNDMQSMFDSAIFFNQSINNWNVSEVRNMSSMFAHSSFNQPINNWDVSKVVYFSLMFSHSSFNQSIGNWNTSNAVLMYGMFANTTAFNQPIGNWNTQNVENFGSMFYAAQAFNQPIGVWITSSCIYSDNMFDSAFSFNQNIGKWNIKNFSSMNFNDCGLQYYNYDSIIMGWTSQNKTNFNISALNIHYCNSVAQRNNAITNKSWHFVGDIQSCTLPINFNLFTALIQDDKVLLRWETATETNNNYFTVQRTTNNDNWQDIETIKGQVIVSKQKNI